MSTSTFHPFPRLPFELRQQVWEYSCLDWRNGKNGLHYIKMDDNRQLTPLHSDWDASPRNRSAYLWHAGLWMACKESRDVVTKDWGSQGWRDLKADTRYLDIRGDAIYTAAFSKECGWRYSMIHRKSNYEPWHQTVDYYCDIFCITAASWEPLVRDWKPIRLGCESGGGGDLTEYLDNIAVEFDPAWTLEIAEMKSHHRIKRYSPPLAFFIRIVLDLAHDQDPGLFRQVRLIDRNAQWSNSCAEKTHNKVFFDCDHEYLELKDINDIRGSTLNVFLGHLNRVLRARLEKIQYRDKTKIPDPDPWESDYINPFVPWDFKATDMVRLVVKRENQQPQNC